MDQAEKLRTIIKKQNQINVSNARLITVTSGKGGVGKSSVSINLALQFRRQGKRVLIFDADFGLANIEVMFGVIPKYSLADLMFKGKSLKDIIINGPEGVMFISGGSGVARLVNLDDEQLKKIMYKLTELESIADVIIIDTGAGISNSVLEFVASSPEVLLVTTPEPTSITDSYALLKGLSMYEGFDKEATKIRLVTNKVNSRTESELVKDKLSTVVKRFLDIDLDFIGHVPADSYITKAIMKQKPVSMVYPNAASTKAFMNIMQKLETEAGAVPVQKKGISGFFKSVFRSDKK